MKLFFSFVAFFILSFQAQGQGFIPGPNLQYNFDNFDWKSFNDKENIRHRIDFMNEMFREIGADFIASDISLGKTDLTRLEQELELYKQGIKKGLSPEEIWQAEEAIKLYRDGISSIENTILEQGFNINFIGTDRNITPTEQDYLSAVKKLYQGDHKIVFDMVEKTDQNLYSALGSDSAYAKMILPQVEQYTKQMGSITQSYYDSLLSAYQARAPLDKKKVAELLSMHSNSLIIYKCFLKNFQNPTDKYQQQLKQVIENWYAEQSALGAKILIETYEVYGLDSNPSSIIYSLNDFRAAPKEITDKIAEFYRKEIINNEGFINTDNRRKLGARVNALIGLKYFDVINEEEQELFNRALEQGVITAPSPNSFFGYSDSIK